MLRTRRLLDQHLEAKTEREDQAYIVMLALGPDAVWTIREIATMWRRLFPMASFWHTGANDVEANVRDAINSHQNIFRKVNGGWMLRSYESSEGYVEGRQSQPSNVQ